MKEKLRIMIIHTEEDIRHVFKAYLERKGHQVTEKVRFADISLIGLRQYDAIIVQQGEGWDNQVTGEVICEECKAICPDTAFILMSGGRMPSGFDKRLFLATPFSTDEIDRILKAAMELIPAHAS